MRASMSRKQNLPQHFTTIGISPGGSFNNSSTLPAQSHSSVASLGNSFHHGAADYRNTEVQQLGNSSPRWQGPASNSDLHISNRWPNNSNESSGHGSSTLDTISAAYSDFFDTSIRGTDGQQQSMDGSSCRYSAAVASLLHGGSPGFGRSALSTLGSGLVSSSPRLCQGGWNSTVDRGNRGLSVDPSKGGLALDGVGRPTTQSLARFAANSGFAERAARFSAFGNGPYSPSFALPENGNVRLSPSFENDGNNRAKSLASVSRSEFAQAAACSPTEVSGRISVPHNNASDGRGGAERGREDRSRRGEPDASGRKTFATLGCSPVVDQDEWNKGRNGDEEETSDSDASDGCRGQRETSGADPVLPVDLGCTPGLKRKSSFADEAFKEASSPSSKERKLKRSKDGGGAPDNEDQKAKSEFSGSENSGLSSSPAPKDSSKTPEQPKLDYIHVRARRGQATDSHSLAERVRREKISERMKYLQNLVPGCSKVTGKAVMLDEIINYVQSIQRQVEFLSMKLAAVTPKPDFNIDSVLSKQLQIGKDYGLPNIVDHADTDLSFTHLQPQQPTHIEHAVTHSPDFQPAVEMNLRRMNGIPMPLPRAPMDVFDTGLSQVSNASLWDGDLQSVVQMGFGQSIQGFGLSGLQCDLPPGHMKMEL